MSIRSTATRAPFVLLAAVSCLSGAILILELALTRIFSVTMLYHFAFLAVSIAMFGLSASSVFVYVTPRRHPADQVGEQLQRYSALFWLVTTISAAALLQIRVGFAYSTVNLLKILGVYVLAAVPFVAGGAGLALVVSRLHADIGRVYAADLLGAACGCFVLIPALNAIGGPGTLLVAAGLGALASFLFAAAAGRQRQVLSWAPVVLATLALAVQIWHPWLTVRETKGHEADRLLFSKWNSFSRIAVYDRPHHEWGLSDTYKGDKPDSLYMDIDSSASTPIIRGGTGRRAPTYLQYELTGLAYALKPGGHMLVIGPGGGRDIWTALVSGASRVEGVEVNPIIVHDVMQGAFRDYAGDIYNAPGVTVAADDGRSYVMRATSAFDVIQASLVDTWAATSAGAFAMTENNLYTVEAFDAYLAHLKPDGILTVTRWYREGLRLLSLASAAGENLGWKGIEDRLFIARHDTLATFILKKTPLRDDEIAELIAACERLKFVVIYAPVSPSHPTPSPRTDYARLATTPVSDLPAFYRSFPWDITPSTDDRPFFFHAIKPGQGFKLRFDRSVLFGSGAEVLNGLILISIVLVGVFIILPLAWLSPEPVVWRDLPVAPLGYFAAMGAGFMLIEIGLMQRFVLFLGHPVYSLSVILFTLLLGGGLGSAISRRIGNPGRALALVIPAIIVASLAYSAVLPPLFASLVGLSRGVRVALSVVFLLPLGVLLGMPLPSGVRLLSGQRPGLLAWAWGINGAMSVLGASAAVYLAMNYGFARVATTGALVYGVAGGLGLWIWRRGQARVDTSGLKTAGT